MIESPSEMTKPKRVWWPVWVSSTILIFILVSTVVWTWQSYVRVASPATAQIGSRAPDIVLPILENSLPGKQTSLRALEGRPVVVNFWATWCGPCRAEFPALEAAYRKYKDSRQLLIVGVDSAGDGGPLGTQQFINEMGATFPIWLDTDESAERTYRVDALPTTIFIDRQGVIRNLIIGGPMSDEFLEKELKRIFD